MTHITKLLTFEISPDGDCVDIHMDQRGLNDLIYYLEKLKKNSGGRQAHDHLMTPAWGGNELTEEKQGHGSKLVNKVTIRLWPQGSVR